MTRPPLRTLLAVCLPVCLLAAVAAAASGESPAPFVVEVHGEGPPVLLIPGLGSPGSVWDGTVARLRHSHELHVLTLAGFAGRPPLGGPFLPTVRDALLAYVDERRLERPALVGHSLGGFLAFWAATIAPERFGPVVAVDGVPFLPALHDPAAGEESARPRAEQARAMMASLTPEQLALQNRMSLAAMIRRPEDVERIAAAGPSDPGAVAQAVYEMMTTDLRDDVAAIRAPVLLVAAGELPDMVDADAVAAAYRAQLAAVPNAELVTIPGARHFVMLDAPEPFHRLLADFLAAGAPPAQAAPAPRADRER